MKRSLALALFMAAAVALPVARPAAAGTPHCVGHAAVRGSLVIPAYDPNPSGGPAIRNPAHDRVTHSVRLFQGYLVPKGKVAVVSVQGVTFRIGPNTKFTYGCFGHSQAEGPRWPRIDVLESGKVTVTDRAGSAGAVSTPAGLIGPVATAASKFVVRYSALASRSVTSIARLAGPSESINITPYVGPRPGTCRHVNTSVLTVKGRGGSAVYDGHRAR